MKANSSGGAVIQKPMSGFVNLTKLIYDFNVADGPKFCFVTLTSPRQTIKPFRQSRVENPQPNTILVGDT